MRRVALVLLLLLAAPAAARPTYFEVLTDSFGFVEGDPLYACGVCHYKWEGTGARNPFGTTVEQQLYLGKPISQALADAVVQDPDADGFTSFEELDGFETLPGYSCLDFFDAVGAPADWHSFVTPGVASCLEPQDVRVAPAQVLFTTDAGKSETRTITIFNNGSSDPIELASYGLLPGAHSSLSVSGPALPLVLAVGETAALEVRFAPDGAVLASATLRIVSDDPDEPELDLALEGFGVVRPLAPAATRAACQRDLEREARRYAKTHLKEWSRCQADEARGVACNAGRRDLSLLRAEERLRAALGGAKDRSCASAGISPTLLGHPDACDGGCGAIELVNFGDLAECLVCRQGEETNALLEAALGAAPPDLPPAAPTRDAAKCQAGILAGIGKAAAKAQALLGDCALDNITAEEPAECEALHAAALGAIADSVDARFARCRDTADLGGCFAGGADPACLGDAALAAAARLVGTTSGDGLK